MFDSVSASESHSRLRSGLGRLLVALPLLSLLVAGQFAAAEHHHAGSDAGTCSLCLLAHAPAVETAAQPLAAAPQVIRERPYLAPSAARADRSIARPSSRAPPRG